MKALWWWLFLFGIWPLSHPKHTTWGNPVTWLDLTLHAVGLWSLVADAIDQHRRTAP